MKIVTDSWHYKAYVLNKMLSKDIDTQKDYNDRIQWDRGYEHSRRAISDPKDFCQYVRDVAIWLPLKILVSVVFYSLVLTVIGIIFYTMYAAGIVSVLTGVGLMLAVAVIFMVALAIVCGIVWCWEKFQNKDHILPEDTFVSEAYKSFKGKYCPIIELEREDVE